MIAALPTPLIAMLAGIGGAAMAWLCGRWLAHGLARWLGRSRANEAPPGNDTPPFWFRVFAGPIGVLAGWAGRRISWRLRRAVTRRLQVAGLHRAIDAAQFIGAQMFAALIGASLLGLVCTSQWGGPIGAFAGLAGAGAGAMMPRLWLRDRMVARRRAVIRALPFALDMITLCVEAGLNLQGALQQAVARGPAGPLRDELRQVLGDMRAGMARAEALRALAGRIDEPAVRSLVAALVQAESMGMNLGALLRSQSDQRRSDRFLRAETLAMQAPVKMLLPLVVFIFPCTFLVIAFPIAVKLLGLAR